MAAIWLSLMAFVPLSVSMSRNTSRDGRRKVLYPTARMHSRRCAAGMRLIFWTVLIRCISTGTRRPSVRVMIMRASLVGV